MHARQAMPALTVAALFYGDSMITPAISVLSAVEGLEIITPALKPYVIPITLLIITGLFFIQKRGTGAVGIAFFFANIIKIPQGGWFPLAMALVSFTVLTTWRRGRRLLLDGMARQTFPLADFIGTIGEMHRVVGTAIFMTSSREGCRPRCRTTSSTIRCCSAASCC